MEYSESPTMSYTAPLATPGLSLYSIPAAFFTAFYPVALKSAIINKNIGYKNAAPRDNVSRLANNKSINPAVLAKVRRMEAAHYNGNEAFPLWAAAVIAANFAGVQPDLLNKISVAYVVLRVIYNHVYFNQTTEAGGSLRSGVWFLATSLPIYLLIKAGNILSNKA